MECGCPVTHPAPLFFYIGNVLSIVNYTDYNNVIFLAIRGKEMTYGENSSPSSFLESLSRKSVCWAASKCRFLLRIGKGSWGWKERRIRNTKLLLLINSNILQMISQYCFEQNWTSAAQICVAIHWWKSYFYICFI